MKKIISMNIIIALIITTLSVILLTGATSVQHSKAAIPTTTTLFTDYNAYAGTGNTFNITVSGVRGWSSKGFKTNVSEVSKSSPTGTGISIGTAYLYIGDTLTYKSSFNWGNFTNQSVGYLFQFYGDSKCNIKSNSGSLGTFTSKTGGENITLTPNNYCSGGYIMMWAMATQSNKVYTSDNRARIRISFRNVPTAEVSEGSFTNTTASVWTYPKATWAGTTNKSYPFGDFDVTYSTTNKDLSCDVALKTCEGLLKTPGVYPVVATVKVKGTDGGGNTYTLLSKTFSYNLTVTGTIKSAATDTAHYYCDISPLITTKAACLYVKGNWQVKAITPKYTPKENEIAVVQNSGKLIVMKDIADQSSENKTAIKWMLKYGFFSTKTISSKGGITYVNFKPTAKISKKALANTLYKMSSQPMKKKSSYKDTKKLEIIDRYSIGWVQKKKIAPKCKSKKYCPSQKVTRAKMAETLRNFVKNPKDKNSKFKPFKDLKKQKSAIRKDIYWAYHEGLIKASKGNLKKNNLKFSPKKKMTNAQIAKLLYKVANSYIKNKRKQDFTTWWF
jgi:hypothetical protein